MHIRILWIGKTRNPCLESLCTDYLNRIQRFVSCDVAEVPDLWTWAGAAIIVGSAVYIAHREALYGQATATRSVSSLLRTTYSENGSSWLVNSW